MGRDAKYLRNIKEPLNVCFSAYKGVICLDHANIQTRRITHAKSVSCRISPKVGINRLCFMVIRNSRTCS
jgi:hypothetical protein